MVPSSHSQLCHHSNHGLEQVVRRLLSAQAWVSSPPRWKSVTLDPLLLRVFTKEPTVLTVPLFLEGLALVTVWTTKEINTLLIPIWHFMWTQRCSWQDQGQVLELFLKTLLHLEISCALQFQQIDTVHMHHPGEECGMEREMGRERESWWAWVT